MHIRIYVCICHGVWMISLPARCSGPLPWNPAPCGCKRAHAEIYERTRHDFRTPDDPINARRRKFKNEREMMMITLNTNKKLEKRTRRFQLE